MTHLNSKTCYTLNQKELQNRDHKTHDHKKHDHMEHAHGSKKGRPTAQLEKEILEQSRKFQNEFLKTSFFSIP